MPKYEDATDSGAGAARFTRRIEDFTCGHCERTVRGNGYTNHCPHCLWSRHVDVNPGDRAATCGGLMPPVAAGIHKDAYFVVQRCEKCGHQRRNKTAPRDSRETILTYFGRPIPG
ncbi:MULTISPECIES: RNHCP domain-containing protein [unclassified Crossiella]|uniref:RNHCP domain-containing protein n=1 Tax=unclassified Crossiella TaxID=2620835 RepID=UPI001FFEC603|nr:MULTISPECIES: RNHCP domain-containing protein [unclassified Crossiella]MCK2244010.1 RNHCP domain-containing protein [Crossiella sp. S99.2]MCK2257132.1 RNHCP domain-containing protein [Crossiella sp. S99.1]